MKKYNFQWKKTMKIKEIWKSEINWLLCLVNKGILDIFWTISILDIWFAVQTLVKTITFNLFFSGQYCGHAERGPADAF